MERTLLPLPQILTPLILPGRIPSKKNSRNWNPKTKRLETSLQYKEWWSQQIGPLRRIAGEMGMPIPFEFELLVLAYWPDKRRADLSNKVESVFDLLVDAGILADDNWTVLGDYRVKSVGIDRDRPRFELWFLEPLADELLPLAGSTSPAAVSACVEFGKLRASKV